MNGNHDCCGLGRGVATEEELGDDSSLLFFVVSSTEASTSSLDSRSDDLRSSLSPPKAGQATAPTGYRSNSYAGSDGDMNGNNDCRGLGRGVATEEESPPSSSSIATPPSSPRQSLFPFMSPLLPEYEFDLLPDGTVACPALAEERRSSDLEARVDVDASVDDTTKKRRLESSPSPSSVATPLPSPRQS